jgi:hypothetical protein
MRPFFSHLVIFLILIQPTTLAFAQDLILEQQSLPSGEADWEGEIKDLIVKLSASEQDSLVLKRLNKIIFWEFEKNILHPPILNKNHTAKKRKEKFVRLINSMILIAERLGDDKYLDQILT